MTTGDCVAIAVRAAESVPAPGSDDSAKGLVVCRQPNGDYTYADA